MSQASAAIPRRASAGTEAVPGAAASRGTDGIVLATVFLASLLLNPLGGISGDARIYMGRAVADLDPAGVGRDLMFTLDGQSAFSIFRILAAALSRAVGTEG